MSAGTRDDGASLMVFCAQEFEAFFSYIGGAVKHYQITGQLPESLFKGHPQFQGGAGDKKAKARRKPTAFNMFVKDKMEEFKAAGIKLDDDKNGNLLFTLAVSEWKKLDDAAKQEYTRKFKVAVAQLLFQLLAATVPTELVPTHCRVAWTRSTYHSSSA